MSLRHSQYTKYRKLPPTRLPTYRGTESGESECLDTRFPLLIPAYFTLRET